MKWLHNKTEFTPSMIADDEPMALINDINRVLTTAINKGFADSTITDSMRKSLEDSVYMFSGFKAIEELSEAGSLLMDKKGNIKSFNTFLREVQVIDKTYNENYLRSEYEFAVSSAQMAAQWDSYDDDVILQYRTANDSRVREAHVVLNNVTLPKDDAFWDSYYAPNGWGCRCNVVEVSEGKYKTTSSKEAAKLGEIALPPKDKKGLIFKYNPAKQRTVFPPKHPYFCRKQGSCDKTELAAKTAQNQLCNGCKILVSQIKSRRDKK